MDITPPSQVIVTPVSKATAAVTPTQNTQANGTAALDWKVSQLIKAVIINITDKQLLLDIQGVKAHSARPAIPELRIGDVLKLQVEQLSPSPRFKIIGLQTTVNTNAIVQHFKNAPFPNQNNLTPLFKNMSFIANRPALRPAPLAAEINSTVREIFKEIPTPLNLKTAAQVKMQLENSGLFLENKIKNILLDAFKNQPLNNTKLFENQLHAKIQQSFKNDIGAHLHRLANLIKTHIPATADFRATANEISSPAQENKNPLPTQTQTQQVIANQASLQNIIQREEAMHTFLRQIESSLNTLQQNQLQNLNDAQANRLAWSIGLPVKDGQDIDMFELRINEEESSKAEGENKKIWNVTLQFDLSGLGKVKAHIKMQNDFVSAQFISEEEKTRSLFQGNFDFLRSRLNYNGLNVGNIECKQGKIKEEEATSQPIRKKLDERT